MSTTFINCKPAIVVHGGAWDIPVDLKESHKNGVALAMEKGFRLLEEGMAAIDVVELVIQILEDDPTFDAGTGSFLSSKGTVECDAMIATDGFKLGAVASLQNIKNPIRVARMVMEKTNHVLLVGKGGNEFAAECGITESDAMDMVVEREKQVWKDMQNVEDVKDKFRTPGDTVGCIVRDKNGRLALGVSTGGIPFKRPGRVGDAPIWGAGGYIETGVGCVSTGFGEDLLSTVDKVRSGATCQEAAEIQVGELYSKVNGYGGVIVLSADSFGM